MGPHAFVLQVWLCDGALDDWNNQWIGLRREICGGNQKVIEIQRSTFPTRENIAE